MMMVSGTGVITMVWRAVVVVVLLDGRPMTTIIYYRVTDI